MFTRQNVMIYVISIASFATCISYAEDIQVFPICTDSALQQHPVIDGDIVVWDDERDYNAGSVYGYNVTNQTIFPICIDQPPHQSWPTIDANIVCWTINTNLYGYSVNTQTFFDICTSGGLQRYPAKSDNIVVWQDGRSGSQSHIYGYDLNTHNEFHISDAYGGIHILPDISGDIVVWSDNRLGSFDIYGYNLATSERFLICDASALEDHAVHISGNIVVWGDDRNGNRDIFGYDLLSQTEFPICTDNSRQDYPDIDGNLVVWYDNRNGNADIYGYDLATQTEFPICTNGSTFLPRVSGNIVVWQDKRNGNYDIYGAYVTMPDALFLQSLNGGNMLITGRKYPIRWESQGTVNDVKIEFSTDSGANWEEVNPSNVGNTGSYDWLIPVVESNQCLIKLTDDSDPCIYDVSDAVFSIIIYNGSLYVDANAAGSNNGSSWADAFNHLQDALAAADPCDEIWVAEGTYQPDRSASNPYGTGDRSATFQLKNDVAIYGGFPSGGGEWQDRNPNTYGTILSGDLDGNDGPGAWEDNGENSYHVVTGNGCNKMAVLDGFIIKGGNANGHGEQKDFGGGLINYRRGSPTIVNCMFTNNSANYHGGGMYNYDYSNPSITNCVLSGNSAGEEGGGIYNCFNSSPTVTKCQFSTNTAINGGGMCTGGNKSPSVTDCIFSYNSATEYGGGMSIHSNSNTTVTNCIFNHNSAGYSGGGMYYSYSCNSTLINCMFSNNSATIHGGGINNDRSSNLMLTKCTFISNSAIDGGGIYHYYNVNLMLTKCMFIGNLADQKGGGMYNYEGCLTITNCTLSGNSSGEDGGGLYNHNANPTITNCTFSGNSSEIDGGGIYLDYTSTPILNNCILWKNIDIGGSEEISQIYSGDPVINYCCVQGWTGSLGGVSNHGNNPKFVRNPDDGGDGWGVGDNDDFGDLHLQSGSPCIDAGDNTAVPPSVTTDLDGNPRFIDDTGTTDTGNGTPPIVDMGAYECALTTNITPEVDAGPDREIKPPENSIKLEGVVTDDGLPEGGELSIIWSVESGPGTVTFDPNEFIMDPCVTFAMPGTYTLRLTANDGELEGHDEVVITYNYDHIYVDIDAAGSNNGTSWANAFNYLQDALAIADFSVEIRVAQGIYKPDQGIGITPGDREASFQLTSSVIVRGGYAGFDAIDPDARNVETYQTILSGDLNGDDGPNFENNSENIYQVVTSTKNNMTAVLDGFTITGGNANGSHPYNLGGGMYNFSSSPTLLNCTFTCNWASHGGGMYNYYSKPILSHCIFSKNSAQGYGGGIRNSRGIPMLTNCTFYGNSANRGGGICDYQNTSRPVLVNCILWGNKDSSGVDETAQISGETSYICYSCVQGLIGSDPFFADPNHGDYHLQSQVGRWEPASQSWVQDNVTSPCIDTGNPLTDCSAELPPNGSIVNMGAYGGTAQASMSPTDLYNVADLNNDGIVNLLDFAILAENWLWEAS